MKGSPVKVELAGSLVPLKEGAFFYEVLTEPGVVLFEGV
jgi:hypothetical protein